MKGRNKIAMSLAITAAPHVWRWARPRLERLAARRRGADAREVEERMVDPLPDAQRSAQTPAPDVFVDPDKRD